MVLLYRNGLNTLSRRNVRRMVNLKNVAWVNQAQIALLRHHEYVQCLAVGQSLRSMGIYQVDQ